MFLNKNPFFGSKHWHRDRWLNNKESILSANECTVSAQFIARYLLGKKVLNVSIPFNFLCSTLNHFFGPSFGLGITVLSIKKLHYLKMLDSNCLHSNNTDCWIVVSILNEEPLMRPQNLQSTLSEDASIVILKRRFLNISPIYISMLNFITLVLAPVLVRRSKVLQYGNFTT